MNNLPLGCANPIDSLWCLTWSHKTDEVRAEPLREHLSRNRRAYTNGRPGDERIILIESQDVCEKTAMTTHGTRDTRARLRAADAEGAHG